EVSAVLTLEPGLHPIKIEFAQQMNGVADAAKCAAAFMYVPEGQSKPIAVPPEMLMVPEWMWSDNAPIITSLSKTEGEIGDEITIKGQSLQTKSTGPFGEHDDALRVTFAGQSATVVEKSESQITIRVPIGAQTGKVIVHKAKALGFSGSMGGWQPVEWGWGAAVPSNSLDFRVTTQFGLTAEWHDLSGWNNFGFEVFDTHVAAVTRFEQSPGHEARPNGFEPCAVAWEGRLGISNAHAWRRLRQGTAYEFWSYAPCEITLGAETKLAQDVGDGMYTVAFLADSIDPGYMFLRVRVVVSEEQTPEWFVLYQWHEDVDDDETEVAVVTRSTEVQRQYYFPAVGIPSPPEIRSVLPVWEEGESPPVTPYVDDSSWPSVRVGQEFTFELLDLGSAHLVESELVIEVFVDDVILDYSVDDVSETTLGRTQRCRAVMPEGVGQGRIVAVQGTAASEPVYVDVTNRGLVGYLYDVPEGSGLSKLPDLAPLTCFKVRKDRQINFESVADFDLPFPAETFVIEWLGGLIIEEEGDYEFICRSDDGMKLWLDDNVVIDADHPQAPAENTATVHLVPGVYRFRMQFFENNQHEVCVLEWRATRGEDEALEELIPRQVIPARAFSLDVHPAFPAKTSTGKRTDGS
ncbi:MAG: IPT/TIG domain-containing protein, partial [Planctomycetes bacterium]|nr:IPT/TIG domain-containing protein [Planctomycetota bacterium]